jgi:hypothetical protein
VLEQLMGRLKKPSPFVRRKALRCIKHVLRTAGAGSAFRSMLLARVDEIRPCASAAGPPDVQLGNEPWETIRHEAAEILDALYRPVGATPSSSGSSMSSV